MRLDRTLIVNDDGKLDVRPKPKTDNSIRDAKMPPSVGTYQWEINLMPQWGDALRGAPYASVTPTVFRTAVATLLADEVGVKAAADQLGNTEEIAQKHYVRRARTQGPDAAREALEAFFNPG